MYKIYRVFWWFTARCQDVVGVVWSDVVGKIVGELRLELPKGKVLKMREVR